MCKILNDYKDDIERYCAENGLSSRKVFQAPKSFNNEMVFLQFHDPAKGGSGMLDDTPDPVTLRIFKTATGLRFEQTEHTRKYLAQ